jgi:hypothetical protein
VSYDSEKSTFGLVVGLTKGMKDLGAAGFLGASAAAGAGVAAAGCGSAMVGIGYLLGILNVKELDAE